MHAISFNHREATFAWLRLEPGDRGRLLNYCGSRSRISSSTRAISVTSVSAALQTSVRSQKTSTGQSSRRSRLRRPDFRRAADPRLDRHALQASPFSGKPDRRAGGAGRFNREVSGNNLMTSAMQHQRGCGPIGFGTEDQETNLDRAPQRAGERARYLRTKRPNGSGRLLRRKSSAVASIRAAQAFK
jgi:hypothetical protein